MRLSRRTVLKGAVASAAAAGLPVVGRAQAEPIKVGILTPLTGAGGNDGPRMLKAMQSVFEEVNKAGGVMGRRIARSSRTTRPIRKPPCAQRES